MPYYARHYITHKLPSSSVLSTLVVGILSTNSFAQCLVPLQYGTEFTIAADQIELNTNPSACKITGTTVKTVGQGSCYIFYRTGSDHLYVQIAASQASLTVHPDSLTKTYGTENPTLTCTTTGFANGDNESIFTMQPQLSTVANETSPVGHYPIVVSGAAADNYAIQYEAGNLAITQASQSIQVDSIAAQTLTAQGLNVQGSATSGLNVSITSNTPDICTTTGLHVQLLAMGECQLSVTQAGNQNYQASSAVTLSFLVDAATVGIRNWTYADVRSIRGHVQILNIKGGVEFTGNIDSYAEIRALGLHAGAHLLRQNNKTFLIRIARESL